MSATQQQWMTETADQVVITTDGERAEYAGVTPDAAAKLYTNGRCETVATLVEEIEGIDGGTLVVHSDGVIVAQVG